MKYKFEPYDCFYWNKSPDFQKPPFHNICRTVTTDNHAPAVVTNEINMEHQENKTGITLPAELQGKKFRIRKLTPRECFRLMGMDETDIDKIQAAGISNSGQYKLAGNSIVVDVLYHIFRKMFIETGPDGATNKQAQQLSLF